MGGLGTIFNGIASYITREHASRTFINEYAFLNGEPRLPITEDIGVVLRYNFESRKYTLRLYELSPSGGLTVVRDGNLVGFQYVTIPICNRAMPKLQIVPHTSINRAVAESVGLKIDRAAYDRLEFDRESYLSEGHLAQYDNSISLQYLGNGIGIWVRNTLIFAITDRLVLNPDATVLRR